MLPGANPKPKNDPGWQRNPRPAETWRDKIEINSDQSFPASDPPSWTPVTRTGSPPRGAPAPTPGGLPAEPSRD